jgi:hypothetical protein
MAYSPDQLRTLLRGAGFKANSQTETAMVGIAYAESGGDPTAYNPHGYDDSYGLWQINMRGAKGATRRKAFGITDNKQLFDPATNAKAAYIVYKDQGLDAWTTYKNGEYLKYTDGMTSVEGGNKNPVTEAKDAVSGQLDGIGNAINAVGANLFKGVGSAVGILVALVLLILGVVILVLQTKAGKGLSKVAKQTISHGAIK